MVSEMCIRDRIRICKKASHQYTVEDQRNSQKYQADQNLLFCSGGKIPPVPTTNEGWTDVDKSVSEKSTTVKPLDK